MAELMAGQHLWPMCSQRSQWAVDLRFSLQTLLMEIGVSYLVIGPAQQEMYRKMDARREAERQAAE